MLVHTCVYKRQILQELHCLLWRDNHQNMSLPTAICVRHGGLPPSNIFLPSPRTSAQWRDILFIIVCVKDIPLLLHTVYQIPDKSIHFRICIYCSSKIGIHSCYILLGMTQSIVVIQKFITLHRFSNKQRLMTCTFAGISSLVRKIKLDCMYVMSCVFSNICVD